MGGLSVEDLKDTNFFNNKNIKVSATQKLNSNMTLVSFMAQTPQGPQKMTAFVSNDKKHVIIGSGFEDKTGKQITIPIDMSKYEANASFVVGNGKEKIYIFTDPECPYCMKMDQMLIQKMENSNYTAYVFFHPLPIHRYAETASYYILNMKSDEEKKQMLTQISNDGFTENLVNNMAAFDVSGLRARQKSIMQEAQQIMRNKTQGQNDPFMEQRITDLQKNYESIEQEVRVKVGDQLYAALKTQSDIAEELGVAGTPTIFDENGTAINWMGLVR